MNDECDPGDHSLILAEEGPTMDTWTTWCWDCPGTHIEHRWNPTGCYANGDRVYWSPHFKIETDNQCNASEAA